jgi:hypothetical protein
MITEAEHKTNILPLRWFANFCNHLGTPHIVKMFRLQEQDVTSGIIWNYHAFMWRWTWAVYHKWGTMHKVIDWNLEEDIDKDDF